MSGLTAALEAWRLVGLDARRGEIDSNSRKFEEHEELSKQGRKKLAEMTKSLKQAPDEDKLKGLGAVLRAYQEEVNNLTKRSQYAETCFLKLYHSLFDAPDPVKLLEEAQESAKKLKSLQEKHEEVALKLEQYDLEFQHLKNQDYTVRKLEQENKEYEKQMEARVAELAAQAKANLDEESQALRRQLEHEQQQHRMRLQAAKDDLTAALSARAQAQARLFDATARAETVSAVVESEAELVSEELARAKLQIESLERRNRELRKSLDSSLSNNNNNNNNNAWGDSSSSSSSFSSSAELTSQLEQELDHTRSLLLATQEAHTRLLGEWQEKQAELQEQCKLSRAEAQRLQQENGELKVQLSQVPDPQKYKRRKEELKALKQAMFSTQHSEADASLPEVERVLQQANRRLETELSGLRVENQSLQRENGVLQEELKASRGAVERVNALNKQLEKDLLVSHETLAGLTGGFKEAEVATVQEGGASPRPQDTQKALFDGVWAQRERFKAKCEKLEQGNQELQECLERFLGQVNVLKADNLNLYEKLRYERAYKAKGDTHDVESGPRFNNEVENKYKELYEESQGNPFQEFQKSQKLNRWKSLSTTEKITLSIGGLVMRQRHIRTFVFFYLFALHTLVFFTIYFHTLC